MKKIEFYLSWILGKDYFFRVEPFCQWRKGPLKKSMCPNLVWPIILEDLVPVGDYILNLNQFQDRIRKEMKQFEDEKDILEHSKIFEKPTDTKILISEL